MYPIIPPSAPGLTTGPLRAQQRPAAQEPQQALGPGLGRPRQTRRRAAAPPLRPLRRQPRRLAHRLHRVGPGDADDGPQQRVGRGRALPVRLRRRRRRRRRRPHDPVRRLRQAAAPALRGAGRGPAAAAGVRLRVLRGADARREGRQGERGGEERGGAHVAAEAQVGPSAVAGVPGRGGPRSWGVCGPCRCWSWDLLCGWAALVLGLVSVWRFRYPPPPPSRLLFLRLSL